MGVLSNVQQYLSGKAKSAAKKASDGVATLSALSPKQLQEVEAKRVAYLSGRPDMDGREVQSAIRNNIGAIGIEVYQAYLEQLGNIYQPVDTMLEQFDEENRIRFFDITKWVTDTQEQSLDKLVNIYHVLSEEECNIALIYHRTKNACQVTVGMVNTNEKQSDPAIADKYYSRVIGAVKGNFPGADIKGIHSKYRDYGIGIPECLLDVNGDIENGRVKSVAVVSNVASEKSEAFISQSMEKLLDGIVPEDDFQEYTIVLLAKPVRDQNQSKNRLYELYSDLKPFESWQTSTGTSENATEGALFNLGGNAGANFSRSKGMNAGIAIPTPAVILSAGANQSHTSGINFGVSFSRSSNISVSVGKNENLTQTFTNYGVKHTLDLIEMQLKRIEESSALGMWEFAAYIISDSPVIANNVAHMYLALTQGEESYLTRAAVNFWDGDIEMEAARTILASIQKLQHPVLGLKTSLEDEWLMYPTLVTPATPLSGRELARALNFPRKSVSGLPVLEVVSFGREPHSLLEEILDLDFGCGYHMRKQIQEQRIGLSKEELTKHTFITGSTGSGKSNTIYRLLERLGEEHVSFLVVEPAKGEYKDVIGRKKGVVTYGTNPNMKDIQMLRINPFRFPEHTHILEHLDRLVEIFQVCWPMYAAMPAILKDSVERAYERCGWNLEKSVNQYDPNLFPTFHDVVKQIRQVLDESDYSDDNKGDYTGSLVTRLRSLTNGINGLIFTTDDLTDDELFDRNVIVDLSRVGSTETKSLIMGLMVLKLQEHRMEQRSMGSNVNDSLKHITVLEEAHNLLKRTSAGLSGEGASLIGKSVEMLANSIAEMRTYGEGFVIADQSPGLLDMSVIRNTNTKIILRLPDFSDRELVGKASGLNDNQIIELAKLEKGVAAISQSDWLEPVLCKIDKYDGKGQPFLHSLKASSVHQADCQEIEQSLLDCIMNREIYRKGDRADVQKLKNLVLRSKLDTLVKCDFIDYITVEKSEAIRSLRVLLYDFLGADDAIKESKHCRDISEWVHSVAEKLSPSIHEYSQKQIDLAMALLIYEKSVRDADYNDILCRFTEVYQARGGVF